MSKPVIEGILVYLVQLVFEIISIFAVKHVRPCLAILLELPIIVQEVVILRELCPSLHSEYEVLVLGVLLGHDIVLDKQIPELGLKQVVALDFSSHVLSELPVGEDQLLNCRLLLTGIDFFHLLTVQGLFKLLNTAS